MTEDLGDWGLLDISDILDADLSRKKELPSDTYVPLGEVEIPLLSCESSYVTRYVQLLIKYSKYDAEQRCSNLEEVDAARSERLKCSLAASELIRERLGGAIESFALTVQQEISKPSCLQTLVLLGTIVCPDTGSFCDALISGTEDMILRTDCSLNDISSSVDLIQMFKSQVGFNALTKEQQKRLFSLEFSLSLRCGKLSALVNCLLQRSIKERLEGIYSPPPLEHRVNYVKAKTDSFLTRFCELPFSLNMGRIYCFPGEDKLVVCSGNRGCVLDQLGMMGTRFKINTEFDLHFGKSAKVIFCDGKIVFVARNASSTVGTVSYSIQKYNCGSGKPLDTTLIVFHLVENTASTHEVIFDISGTILTCLVCSEASRISNSKCYLLQKNIDSIFIKDKNDFYVNSNNSLKRGPGLWNVKKKYYYFTKGNSISIGRVTLKDNFHPFTIEMWVYPCNATDDQVIISIGDKNIDEILIEIEPTSEGVLWRGGSRTPHLGASFVSYVVPGKLAFCRRWWHVALIFKGNSWELWINDGIVAQTPALISPEAIIDVECSLGKSFVGCLAEVRIWNCIRTPAQLFRDSKRSLSSIETSLIGYYPLDESEGDVISDYAINASHALLHNEHATWLSVDDFPVISPSITRCIDDFAPIALRESPDNIFLSSCPGYIALGIPTSGPSLTICEYATCDFKLVFQARVELPARAPIKGLGYNALRHSMVCYALAADKPKRLLIWELHQQHYFPFLQKDSYNCIWECEKDLLTQCAAYAKRLVGAERCLVDQLSWSVQVPRLVVDTSDGLLSGLLRHICNVQMDQKDNGYTKNLCALLHANLLCRVENHHEGLKKEIGDLFPDAQSLIKAAQECSSETLNTRSGLLRLAFQETFYDTGLLSMTCRCLLSEKSRLGFIKNQAGRGRLTEKEDMLFRSLLDYYGSLLASNILITNTENAHLFCISLMSEEVFQVERWITGHNKAIEAVRRTSYCLEVFQEILLAKVIEKPQGECGGFAITYAKLLLRTGEKIIDLFAKSLRKKPEIYQTELINCMELSVVGSLLPSFTVAIPLLPTTLQGACVPYIKGCREALFSLTDTLPKNAKLSYDLGVALTSALCRIGCSLLVSSDVVTSQIEAKYLHLLCGGVRKSGSERDAIIKNLQQGVGYISKLVDELHREDVGALPVLKDDRLIKLERLLMTAFCALLIPTDSFKQVNKQTLAPMYRYVHNMRSMVLSKRQESVESLDVLEHRALFLSRFEPICGTRTEYVPHFKYSTKDASPQRKWKQFFQTWKALRVLKTKLPQQREMEGGDLGSLIVQFLQEKDMDRENIDRLVIQQTQRAQYRLSGMMLLKQLLEEARVSDKLAHIVIPVLVKAFTGWYYADDVQCCSKEDFLRLHGAFFHILELVAINVKHQMSDMWAELLLALLTSELRVMDFRRIKGDIASILCSLWKFEKRKDNVFPRYNANMSGTLRNTLLSASGAAPTLVIGRSGRTIKGLGGRGTCVAPCEWFMGRKNFFYYFEVLIIDLGPGGSCCVGAGPSDYGVSRLPGCDAESYALHTEEGMIYEGNSIGRLTGFTFSIGDVVGCGLNTKTREICWIKNGKDLVFTLHVTQQKLYPLIGMSGKGLVKVNFGADRFMFDKVPGFKSPRRSLGENAWDVFRVFSIRAALGFVESCNGSTNQSRDALKGLRTTLEEGFECICVEMERTLPLSNSEMFIITLCAHLTTLAKVLVSARNDALTPSVQRVAGTLQRGCYYAFRSYTCTSRVRCALMTAWFAFMNLSEPANITEDNNLPGFLDTLLTLGRELEWVVSQRPITLCESTTALEAWTALALLQHMNSDESLTHRWREKLHIWIMQSLEGINSNRINTSLALRILFGGPRLAVPGDRIMVRKSKHATVTVTLVDYSLDDETCDVIENEEKRFTVSLRQAEITIGDETSSFPQKDNTLHISQINQVLQLAQGLWSEHSLDNGMTGSSLKYRSLAIVWRCVQKGLLLVPKEFLTMLAKLYDNGEIPSDEQQAVVQDRLVIEYSLLGKVLSENIGFGNTLADTTEKHNSDDGETRTRLAQELSMRGYNLDLCFLALDETNNDLQAALQLLGDHHGDFISTQRRTTFPSSEDEDISSDEGEMDAAEYDIHVLFPPESDDEIDDEISVDRSDPLNDGIRFLGGYVSITGEHPLGNIFTIDMHLYLFDVTVPQIVFYQKTFLGVWQFVARVQGSALHCGWEKVGDNTSSLCKVTIEYTDSLRWIHLTMVQDMNKFYLYKAGILQSEMNFSYKGVLLENTLYLGGSSESEEMRLNGGMKGIRIFDVALTREEVTRFVSMEHTASFSHRSITLECTSDTIKSVSTDGWYKASVHSLGPVTWFEQLDGEGRSNNICQQEIDFTTQNDETGIFTIDTLKGFSNFITLWRRRKDQRKEQLVTVIPKLDRQLACYYALAILTHMMRLIPDLEVFLGREQVHKMVRFAVNSNDPDLLQSLLSTTQYLIKNENGTIINYIKEELVEMVQREQKMLVFESPHPFKSTLGSAHEVYVPGRRAYEVHFDTRCSSSSMLVTFYADHTLSSVITQAPGYALNSLFIRAPRFFFDVRLDTSTPQWGYKIMVLYDTAVPRFAAHLLRSMVCSVITRGIPGLGILNTNDCLDGLANASRMNVGITRCLILSCMSDILLHMPEYTEPMHHLARMHDLRRMSERLFRRTLGSQHLQSRFVQVVSEFYVALKDAEHCWQAIGEGKKGLVRSGNYDATTYTDCFLQKRMEQRNLYKRREGLRVTVEKDLHPESLRVGVNPNRTILVWSERTGSSVIGDVPLGSGRWYFEVRMMASGDAFIGVIPSWTQLWSEVPTLETFVAFNGKTGVYHGVKEISVPPRRIWKGKDYVGVVMDGIQKTCSFIVNGYDTGVFFRFGTNESEAVSAAGANLQDEQEVSYHPFFMLEEEEGITINFGGAHFEYEPPRNSFPLDPANLRLGTLIPYNQIRAFHDLATYIVSAGRIPLPPFCEEEANPFEGSTERFGPPNVSLQSTTGVQVNLLVVRNTGTNFATLRANCRVSGGKWYYEVTLRSQGLMQIGWCSSNDPPDGTVGDTPTSWSVDLFRRMKWHDGKPEPLTASRRWVVGDVIGCALDLVGRKMIFLCNGRLLCDTTLGDSTFTNLPITLSYEPAISFRSGNEVLFNFGSSSFKYKPEGFCALGVPDSWNERIDAFYSTLQPSTTLLRLRELRNMWLSTDLLTVQDVLKPYSTLVDIIQEYCKSQNKDFAQLTEEVCKEIFQKTSIPIQEAWKKYKILTSFSRVVRTVIPFLNLDTQNLNISTKLFLSCRTILSPSFRNEMVDDILRETNVRSEHFRVSVNRMKAHFNKGSWMSSIFGQTFSLIADQHPRIFRTNKRFWSVLFLGEGSEDVGGPFREHIGEMCRELMSTALPFFVPTANNVHNIGTCRDAFIPASSATSLSELSAFVFIGQLMGGALRSSEPLGLFLPPLVWKFLCFYPIVESDLDDVDRICLQCIREFRALKSQVGSNDMFDDVFDSETFTTRLSDGSVKELIPGGGSIRVTLDRCEAYANALAAARLEECLPQLRKLREGLLSVLPAAVLCLLGPAELELRVCGRPDYAVAELREGAVCEGLAADDRRVVFLWQALEDATAQQRRLFLRFVSGRDRLPVRLRILPLATTGDPDGVLPRAATCFFALELPDYSSLEVLKAKLYYSIENCADIDTDFNPREVDESEAPQLMIGVEDARPDEMESSTWSE
ncbi:hypothetical protein LSM04_000370 [Trypanosoma melophagium]|uniref:uncharacterized protein n=1 Tax=Trypanosoma melophagium TaxID=715481 RepID=UPI00351A0865|nr:hypothetical protein LSM04_000370 [Trypanosoma melophagium]